MKVLGTFVGFLMMIYGFLSLILSVAGLQFSYLTFLDIPGKTFGFLMRILMVLVGTVIIVMSRTDWERERAELEDL